MALIWEKHVTAQILKPTYGQKPETFFMHGTLY